MLGPGDWVTWEARHLGVWQRLTVRISRFERMLTDEGALILKFWFHLSQKAQKRRLKELEDENRRLKHMVADLSLDKEALKAVIRKNGWSL